MILQTDHTGSYPIRLFLIGLFLLLGMQHAFSQAGNTSPLSAEEVATYKEQARRMVSFLEFSFNTLGSVETPTREKETIINESYLKAFENPEVQIEDDLVLGRSVSTRKDVQAYLKDIDFFYKDVRFEFMVEEVTYRVNAEDKVYFTVTTSRNLQGVSIENDSVNQSQIRFVEMNLDVAKQDLKVVSIYTSKESEQQSLANWWNSLDYSWKYLFGDSIYISPSHTMRDALKQNRRANFGDTLFFSLDAEAVEEDTMISDLAYLLPEYNRSGYPAGRRNMDTVVINNPRVYGAVRKLLGTKELDLSYNKNILSLEALSKFSNLRKLSVSHANVVDLFPLRNLTQLEVLDISATNIRNLSALKYAANLKELYASESSIRDFQSLSQFSELQKLDLSFTSLRSLAPLRGLGSLKELDVSNTNIITLSDLQGLSTLRSLSCTNNRIFSLRGLASLDNLEVLNIENTEVDELTELANNQELRVIFCDDTRIRSLKPLENSPNINRVYCDRTGINRYEAQRFSKLKPGVMVVFESEILEAWWHDLPASWKTVLRSKTQLSEYPSREELHALSSVEEVDLSEYPLIKSLGPVNMLVNLKKLNCSGLDIRNISPLSELNQLEELILASTQISSLEALRNLKNLKYLNCNKTDVSSLLPLIGAQNLEVLEADYTQIETLTPLEGLSKLETVYCDFTPIDIPQVRYLKTDALIIFKTPILREWWETLPRAWQNIFKSIFEFSSYPDQKELHKIINLESLSIQENDRIYSLGPLTEFTQLQELSCERTQITDISPLRGLSTLRELRLTRNPITNINEIGQLKKLQVLHLKDSPLEDIEFIGSLSELKDFRCSGTPVKNIKILGGLYKLNYVDISNTEVKSLKPLESLTQLQELICYNTNISGKKAEQFKKDHPKVNVVHY
ncbi:MAG: hypothetical protein AAF824_13570 [Bacteroidota bacterium]